MSPYKRFKADDEQVSQQNDLVDNVHTDESDDDDDEVAWVPISPEMAIANTVQETLNDMMDNIIDEEERCFLGKEDAIHRNFSSIYNFFNWLMQHVTRTYFA